MLLQYKYLLLVAYFVLSMDINLLDGFSFNVKSTCKMKRNDGVLDQFFSTVKAESHLEHLELMR